MRELKDVETKQMSTKSHQSFMSDDFASYFQSNPTFTKRQSYETKHCASHQQLFYAAKNGILEPLQIIPSSKIMILEYVQIDIIVEKLCKS